MRLMRLVRGVGTGLGSKDFGRFGRASSGRNWRGRVAGSSSRGRGGRLSLLSRRVRGGGVGGHIARGPTGKEEGGSKGGIRGREMVGSNRDQTVHTHRFPLCITPCRDGRRIYIY